MVMIAALALTVAGCGCLYLASPNQNWLARSLPARTARMAGMLLLAAGAAAFIAKWRLLCGVFMALDVAIICLLAFPCIATLWRLRRAN